MDWKDVAKSIAQLGLPLLGAALPIPGGAAIGSALASAIGSSSANPSDILATLQSSADALAKAKQFEEQHREKLMEMAYNYELELRKADSSDLAAVNATMQAEAAASASENWWQKGWRPANGYVLALASLIAVIFVCVLFYQAMTLKDGPTIATVVAMIPQLAFAIASILAVPGAAVGITAWHRGRAQIAQIQAAVKEQL
jgi:hypothetical protein